MATQHGALPTRAASNAAGGGYISDDDVVPANNPTSTTELLTERLQAWKHMCGYLEGYVSEVAKDQKSQAKDQEKILKTLSHPLREGHHFDQALGGVAGLFENLRANTQSQISLHGETSKNLTGTVLPILERLHSEIKSKAKELDKGAGKGSKAVESARAASQKHIEALGQHSANFDSGSAARNTAQTDPYVIQKQALYSLNKQLQEENNNRGDLIAVQNSFAQFEAHVIQTVQQALTQYNQFMCGQADRQKAMYGDIAANASHIPMDFEWKGFLHRNSDKLISPNAPQRTIDTVTFPNQGHRATKALIEGSLERKHGLGALGSYKTGYYAVTPSGYLHEFKDNDNFRHDPTPETSLYLRDCIIGGIDGTKFTIKGKDSSGSKISQKLSTTSEYSFKAHSPQDAAQWHQVLLSQTAAGSVPTSPVESQTVAPINTAAAPVQPGSQPHSATNPHAPGINTQVPVATGPGSATVPPSATSAHGSVPPSATSATAPTHPPAY